MDFGKFVEWAFLAIIGGSVAWSAGFLSRISQSVTELNVKLATIMERLSWQSRELDDHGNRIRKLEGKNK